MRRINLSLFSFAIIVSFLICGISIVFDERNLAFNQEQVTFLNKDWFYQTEDGNEVKFTAPGKVPTMLGKPFEIYTTFREAVSAGDFLGFRSSQQEVFISLDDKVIYSFEQAEHVPTLPRSPASAWHIVKMPEIQPGQVLEISTKPFYRSYQGEISEIMLGSKSAILFQIAEMYLPAVFMSILVLMFAVMLFIYGIYIYKVRRSSNLIYLGLFAFLLGIWFFAESRFVQFFFGNVSVIYQMVFLCIALMPIPGLLFFINALQPKNQWHYDLLCIVAVINFFGMVIAQTLGFIDFFEWMPISHIIIILVMLLFFHTMVESIQNDSYKKSKFIFVGFSVFIFSGILNIIYFYLSDQFDSAIFLRLGTLLALGIIAKGEINKNVELIRIGFEAAAYKKAAYTDALTQLGNRYAFDTTLKELEQTQPDENLDNAICVFDVDGLKFANDSYGHWMGDQLICSMADSIKTVFSKIGKCFRIGGDEFAVVLQGERAELEGYLDKLSEEIKRNNANGHSNLSASWGMAFQSDTRGNNIYETFQMADALMYQNKEIKKPEKKEIGATKTGEMQLDIYRIER
ncbi:MAG: GGDEF domain-containing protein [Anaerotignum sp.]|nr:GGDEF domain-containing protein [Anaerotignum sp.]